MILPEFLSQDADGYIHVAGHRIGLQELGERIMITFEITADVKDDRRVVLTLPAEVPTGQAKLVVTVNSPPLDSKQPQTSFADWVEIQPGQNGSEGDRYLLRGSVVRYDRPTDPVAEEDWEALR